MTYLQNEFNLQIMIWCQKYPESAVHRTAQSIHISFYTGTENKDVISQLSDNKVVGGGRGGGFSALLCMPPTYSEPSSWLQSL